MGVFKIPFKGLFFFHCYHVPTFIGSAGGAGMVRQFGNTALGAFNGIRRFYFLMGTPFIPS
jgi:hypothetical protein